MVGMDEEVGHSAWLKSRSPGDSPPGAGVTKCVVGLVFRVVGECLLQNRSFRPNSLKRKCRSRHSASIGELRVPKFRLHGFASRQDDEDEEVRHSAWLKSRSPRGFSPGARRHKVRCWPFLSCYGRFFPPKSKNPTQLLEAKM